MATIRKRGRPATFPVDETSRLLALHKDVIVVDGGVVGKNHQIWKDISETLNSITELKRPVSAYHLYVVVTENRYGLLNTLVSPDGSCKSVDSVSEPESLSSNEEETSQDSSGKKSTVDTKKFKIAVSRQDWNDMRPELVTYKDSKLKCGKRTYFQLKRKSWTNIFNSYFWQFTKLPCTLKYFGGRVSQSNFLHAIQIYGNCKYCKSKLKAFVENVPVEGEPATFHCSYKGNFNVKHPKKLKRNLSGNALEAALRDMKGRNVAPTSYHRHLADKVMCFGEPEPAHLPSTSQLRRAKYKSLAASQADENPIVALGKAMHESRLGSVIRDVSYDKFSVRYHSSSQIQVYREHCKNNFPVSGSIDATGGVVKRITRAPGVKSGNIFLYSFVVRDKVSKKIYPVTNFLSERHDTETLRHWLAQFLRCDVTPPNEVVIDMSPAIMSACVQAFTALPSLEAYSERCAQLLNQPGRSSGQDIPNCFIRNDVAHVIKLITTWKCLKNTLKITKQFYVRSMCQIIKSTTIEDVQSILKHIITVATTSTEGADKSGKMTPCEMSKNFLVKKIGGFTVLNDADSTQQEQEARWKNFEIKSKRHKTTENNIFYQMVVSIIQNVDKKRVVGNRGNQQYVPDIAKKILEIAPLIPTWTSVMVPVFGYGGITASSTAVESEFNIVKNVIFKHMTLPMRVDDFVFHHTSFIEGDMKIAAATNEEDYSKVNSDDVDTNSEVTHMTSDRNSSFLEQHKIQIRIQESKVEEDWGGLVSGIDSGKRKHSSYLQPYTEITISDMSRARPLGNIGILKNGNLLGLKPLNIENERVILSNTCAFDSLAQLFCIAFCDSEEFKSAIENSSNRFMEFINEMVSNGVSRKIYLMRGEMLTADCKDTTSLPEGIKRVSCETCISPLATQLLRPEPSVFEHNICTSMNCPKKERRFGRVPLTIYINSSRDIGLLEQFIDKELCSKKKNCSFIKEVTEGISFRCQGKRRITMNPADYLLIEVVETENMLRLVQCLLKVRDLPHSINIDGRRFMLRGCVAFIGSENVTDIGHYVTYGRRSDGKWETYDDLRQKIFPAVTNKTIKCQLVLYTV